VFRFKSSDQCLCACVSCLQPPDRRKDCTDPAQKPTTTNYIRLDIPAQRSNFNEVNTTFFSCLSVNLYCMPEVLGCRRSRRSRPLPNFLRPLCVPSIRPPELCRRPTVSVPGGQLSFFFSGPLCQVMGTPRSFASKRCLSTQAASFATALTYIAHSKQKQRGTEANDPTCTTSP
jgi:hypothetical protein